MKICDRPMANYGSTSLRQRK